MGKWADVACNCSNRVQLACGHRGGLAIEFWPGNIIAVGSYLGSGGGALPVFAAVGDPMNYDNDDELHLVSPLDAESWLREIEEVRQALDGGSNLPREHVIRLLCGFAETERRLETPTFTPFEIPDTSSPVHLELGATKIREALADAETLCRASIATGNPIRLLW